jgi:hypothetical protein
VLRDEELAEAVLMEAVLADVLSIVELDAEGEAGLLLEASTGLNIVVVEALDEAAMISIFLSSRMEIKLHCIAYRQIPLTSTQKLFLFAAAPHFLRTAAQTPAPPR